MYARSKAFTLIELLIVVAIIAILAAIAVPNFLEAQVRSKVSRSKADMRSLTVGIEAYAVDNNNFPSDTGGAQNGFGRPYAPGNTPAANFTIGYDLTTPISYLSSVSAFRDVFKLQRKDIQNNPGTEGRDLYNFANWSMRLKTGAINQATYDIVSQRGGDWVLFGAGPDTFTNNNTFAATDDFEIPQIPYTVSYDPTNGTVSVGDIFRSQLFGDGIRERVPVP